MTLPDPHAPHFFGYGSLVNRGTHAYGPAHPARLRGWRRMWVQTALRPAAFLSARPAGDGAIAGLIAPVPGGDFAALDLRETGYARVDCGPFLSHGAPHAVQAQVYRVVAPEAGEPGEHAILLSYLDAVVQGFAREYGVGGVDDFFDTTDGWHLPVLDDRGAPLYPRAQRLTAAERALVDDRLAARGCRIRRA